MLSYPTITAAELNDQVFCRVAPSSIHGVGVVAVRTIPNGTAYNTYWNELNGKRFQIAHDEWGKVDPAIQDIILASGCFTDGDEGSYIIEHPNSHHCLFVNHAEVPNTEFGVALRDIAAGEEITRYCNGIHDEVVKHFAKQGIIIKN